MSTFISTTDVLDFFTPLRFRMQAPELDHNIENPKKKTSNLQRWVLEKATDYFQINKQQALYIEGYDVDSRFFIARRLEKTPNSYLLSILKIISYATLIFPLIAFVSLLIAKQNFYVLEKPDKTERSFSLLKKHILRFKAKKEKNQRLKKLFFTLTQRIGFLKGGEILLSNAQPAWVSFTRDKRNSDISHLFIKTIPSSTNPMLLIASAKMTLTDEGQNLSVTDCYTNQRHPYMEASRKADSSLADHPSHASIEIAQHILGAAIRFLADQPNSNEESTLNLAGSPAEALTLDGPSRILEDFYIKGHIEPDNPLSKTNQLEIRCQDFIQTAREQIFLPKQIQAFGALV